MDDGALRDYCYRYLREARSIQAEAAQTIREVEDFLAGGRGDTLDPVQLEKWLAGKREVLQHQRWELLLLAGAIGTPWWCRWLHWLVQKSPRRGSFRVGKRLLQGKKRLP